MEDAKKGANAVMTIDLESQTISRPDGEKVHFEIDPFRKHCLLNGLDDIGLTEQKSAEIAAYEEKARLARPLAVRHDPARGLSVAQTRASNRKVLVLAGDGIGPEIMRQALRVIEFFDRRRIASFEIAEGLVGGAAL